MTPEERGRFRETSISVSDVEAELAQILASKAFAQGERLRQFLEFTVNWPLTKRSEQLKEYVLAVEA